MKSKVAYHVGETSSLRPNLFANFGESNFFKESKMLLPFQSSNLPKSSFNNLKAPKSGKVDVSHQFKSEGSKGEVDNILVVDFSK